MVSLLLKNLRRKTAVEHGEYLNYPISDQIRSWKKANRKMRWGIRKEEFHGLMRQVWPGGKVDSHGFNRVALFYGFGDDGHGNADSVLSGKVAWEYVCRSPWRKTWQCRYIDFNKSDHIRLRPGAPPRPRGFYFAVVEPGEEYRNITVTRARKAFQGDTGLGPEGIQLITITHTHLQDMMNERTIPFMALADYDVAPYGFSDFFDAVQIFCSLETLGLGIGNVDRKYPAFGIPALRLMRRLDTIENGS